MLRPRQLRIDTARGTEGSPFKPGGAWRQLHSARTGHREGAVDSGHPPAHLTVREALERDGTLKIHAEERTLLCCLCCEQDSERIVHGSGAERSPHGATGGAVERCPLSCNKAPPLASAGNEEDTRTHSERRVIAKAAKLGVLLRPQRFPGHAVQRVRHSSVLRGREHNATVEHRAAQW
eukprot:CAMPEP_0119312280 /NCGR_PEP_ID=MMETSP1333-20130426/25758_1 /TAXON_ID=418940 /ORGANISM="Scyphosphaera apsteinii, Strain RCC1455" /LENGTH=178 /DNA_ID=CAMNT_0007316879 /DNA_START=823 /DNA_END=1356 /DNA_ORIENTATION=-